MIGAANSPLRDGSRLDAVTADLVVRFGRERTGVYSLERMRRLMRRLGDPQEHYRVVHVAGTSGKTSTCYAVRELLESAGVRTGLTVSPHISHLDERVQIHGGPLDTDQFISHVDTVLDKIKDWDDTPSFFEFMAAVLDLRPRARPGGGGRSRPRRSSRRNQRGSSSRQGVRHRLNRSRPHRGAG